MVKDWVGPSDATVLLARKLAQRPADRARASMKQNFNAADNGSRVRHMFSELEARRQIEGGRTDDHREAVRAFVEKRPPAFAGR